jgi:hypothetical protein
MKSAVRFLALTVLALGVATGCHADPANPDIVSTSLFTARFPSGWNYQSIDRGFDATPREASHAQAIGVLSCERASQNRSCVIECSAAAVRRNYFWFFSNSPNTIYSEFKRNGFTEYRAAGKFGESDVWAATAVLCNDYGLVAIVSQSQVSAESIAQLDAFVKTVTWRKR